MSVTCRSLAISAASKVRAMSEAFLPGRALGTGDQTAPHCCNWQVRSVRFQAASAGESQFPKRTNPVMFPAQCALRTMGMMRDGLLRFSASTRTPIFFLYIYLVLSMKQPAHSCLPRVTYSSMVMPLVWYTPAAVLQH